MVSFEQQRITSPDGRFEAFLKVEGRTSWELTRVRLHVAGLMFRDRAFDWHGVWSPCSRYFAIMEWCHDNVLHIPAARLVVMDLLQLRERTVDSVESGFVEPLCVRDERIRYVRIDLTNGGRSILERPISGPTGWNGIGTERQSIEGPGR